MDFDTRAINQDKIPDAQTKIENFIKAVNDEISKIGATSSNISYVSGVKGEDQRKAIEGYIEDAITKLKSVTGKLNSFSSALNQISINYSSQGATTATIAENAKAQTIDHTGEQANTGVAGFGD